jgi:hypothetical protein
MPIVASALSDTMKSKPRLKFRKVSAFVIRLIDAYNCAIAISLTED